MNGRREEEAVGDDEQNPLEKERIRKKKQLWSDEIHEKHPIYKAVLSQLLLKSCIYTESWILQNL